MNEYIDKVLDYLEERISKLEFKKKLLVDTYTGFTNDDYYNIQLKSLNDEIIRLHTLIMTGLKMTGVLE